MSNNGDKYKHKDTGEVFQAKQVVELSQVYGRAKFNDGEWESILDTIPKAGLGDWVLTSAAGEVTTVSPGDFYKEFTHHYEEGLRII